jgi:hypothetical protein
MWQRQKSWWLNERTNLDLIVLEETGLLDSKKKIWQLVIKNQVPYEIASADAEIFR